MTTAEYLKTEDKDQRIEFNKALLSKYPWLEPRSSWTGKPPEDYDFSYTQLDSMPAGWRLSFGDRMLEEIHEQLVRFNYVDTYRVVEIKEKYGGLRWYDSGTPTGKLSTSYKTVIKRGFNPLPQFDNDKFYLERSYSEHYISTYDARYSNMTSAEINAYNEESVHYYRLYKLLDKCKIPDIVHKYELLSYDTCIICGKRASLQLKGYVVPYCKACAKEYTEDYGDGELADHFVPIY